MLNLCLFSLTLTDPLQQPISSLIGAHYHPP